MVKKCFFPPCFCYSRTSLPKYFQFDKLFFRDQKSNKNYLLRRCLRCITVWSKSLWKLARTSETQESGEKLALTAINSWSLRENNKYTELCCRCSTRWLLSGGTTVLIGWLYDCLWDSCRACGPEVTVHCVCVCVRLRGCKAGPDRWSEAWIFQINRQRKMEEMMGGCSEHF